jgi:hypothetical protein
MKFSAKHTMVATAISLTLLSTQVLAEESWLDKIKNAIGLGSDKPEQVEETANDETEGANVLDNLKNLGSVPSADGLLTMLTSNLGVTNEQASGGMGALLNYAKENVSSEQFSAIGEAVPGLEGLLSQAPSIESLSSEGLGGLLNKAAEYSDSLQSLALLKQQFDALGLDTDMILQYVEQAKAYLDTPAGQSAKEMLEQAFGNLSL